MLVNVLILLAVVAIAGLFVWLARRALRLRNLAARVALGLLASVPALLFVLVAGLAGYGYTKLYLPRSVPALALDTAATPDRVARGEHLARTTCVACHATDGQLPLSGGIDLSSHSPVPVGTIVPPNLTPGGPLKAWSDEEIAQAIRNGLHKNGRTLLMPTETLRNLSDDDLAALVAFLRSQPPVQHETPPLSPSPLLAFFFGAGLAELGTPPISQPVVAPPRAANAAYGEYIVSYQDCRTCHGAELNGSAGGLAPPAPSARAFARAWTLEEFIQTMRTGVDPGGHAIQEPMPWQMIGQMDDVELAALYQYLRSANN
ncbi:MAG TPA: cytochrome c [Roseiflexaceae bacterium]|nr:cytochrome c [Roseiflexaceae bacterium]